MNLVKRAFGNTGWPVLVGRLLLLAAALVFAVMGLRVAFGGDEPSGRAEHYVCPMHPDVTSERPGECSVCKMALEKVRKSSQAPAYSCAMHPDVTSEGPGTCPVCKMELTVAAQQVKSHAAERTKTRAATGGAYVCPMHPEQTSDEPGRCSVCKMDLQPGMQAHQPTSAHVHHGTYACVGHA